MAEAELGCKAEHKEETAKQGSQRAGAKLGREDVLQAGGMLGEGRMQHGWSYNKMNVK